MQNALSTRRTFLGGLMAVSALAPTRLWGAPASRAYRIEEIDLFVRMTPPGRLAVAIGKNAGPRPKPERNPIAHVRMVVSDSKGNTTFGCSGDRMSVRWLDKRPGRGKEQKLQELVALCEVAKSAYLQNPEFDDPFTKWLDCYHQVRIAGQKASQEELTSAFASALLERAMLDAVCRLAAEPIFNMFKQDRLGFAAGKVLPELKDFDLAANLAARPRTRLHARHTVGKVDPLRATDLAPGQRLKDGLPQTLDEYVRTNGHTRFKLKASGDVDFDLARMKAIWSVLPPMPETLVTIDANEAYSNLEQLEQFVDGMRNEQPAFFQRVAFIEQPLPRALTLDKRTAPAIRRIAAKVKLIIDEADGSLTAFQQARAIGYDGCSHKNCKGLFKSLLNLAQVRQAKTAGKQLLLSGEDLQNMPIVPLHQDFAAVSLLGLTDCERNGHHFNYGLCMVSERERRLAEQHHSDMYRKQDGELFLNINRGIVNVASLQCPGFGIRFEPDWKTMQPMKDWLAKRSDG